MTWKNYIRRSAVALLFVCAGGAAGSDNAWISWGVYSLLFMGGWLLHYRWFRLRPEIIKGDEE